MDEKGSRQARFKVLEILRSEAIKTEEVLHYQGLWVKEISDRSGLTILTLGVSV